MLNGLTSILILIHVGIAVSLQCLEGSDCVLDASCGECSGVACTRVVSHSLDDNKEIALTCLPYDTRNYHKPQLEEQGCRVHGDRQTCICYSHDYCNSTSRHFNFFKFYGFFSLTFFCLIFVFHLQ
ncbi:hypothetical protein CAEBREN_16366 [Caenorhabditis brenneri]|uniref:Uncharacterized protein n=1 Tax=Caenorhabditis brenneri TaxID=135651 RepID=G0NKM4_CAEBE|nr:hypothetical protein CAEBREN_16366 [Caenorhabditis brenneri]